jgi:uncharacterized protein
MIIDFSRQIEKEIRFANNYAPDKIDLDDETARVVGDLRVSGTARKQSEIARVKGTICGQIEVACSRCLQSAAIDLKINFENEFVTLEVYEQSETDRELSAADLDVSIYDGEKIDLNEIVREQILLNLPAQQLCSENCRGLCPRCRTNKNQILCDCETSEIDLRQNAFKQLARRE